MLLCAAGLACVGASLPADGFILLGKFAVVPLTPFWEPQPFGLGIRVGPGRRNASRGILKKKERDRKSFKQCKKTEVAEEKTVMIHVKDDDLLMQYRKGPLDGVKSASLTVKVVFCSLTWFKACHA